MNKRLLGILAATAAVMVVAGGGPALAADPALTSGFVGRAGDDLTWGGKAFRFAGSNNYYLMYKTAAMVDDVFADARGANLNVLRTWGFLDIGNQDDSNSVHHKEGGVYFQYWDGTRPAYNDGADGLEHLDYVLYAAGRAGIKLVIPLTNNWSAFGGMDQYVRWRGGQYHDDFYRDPVIRGWYKDWIGHLLNRTNTLTGILCTDPGSADFTVNCGDGVDSLALAELPTIDLMSFHLYPDGWQKDAAWGVGWIRQHAALASRIGKPVMLGEFGQLDKATRNPTYRSWTDAARSAGLDGFLYWILSGVQEDGTNYPDYDGFTVYCPSPVCTTISNGGDELRFGQKSRSPMADHDTAQTQRDEPVTLVPTANDVAYRTRLRPGTLDLDPAAGQQSTASVGGGVFAASTGGVVTFTPATGFVGRATAGYTVRDEAGRTSNVAELGVTVKPQPGDALVISDFEADPEGWAPASWQTNAGTVSSTVDFYPRGARGLHVTGNDGGWFGLSSLPEPIDLSGRSFLRYDLRTVGGGTSISIAVQTGPGFAWCQSSWGWVNAGTVTTVEVDLLDSMSCDSAALADVRAVFVWFSGGADFDIDFLRAE